MEQNPRGVARSPSVHVAGEVLQPVAQALQLAADLGPLSLERLGVVGCGLLELEHEQVQVAGDLVHRPGVCVGQRQLPSSWSRCMPIFSKGEMRSKTPAETRAAMPI